MQCMATFTAQPRPSWPVPVHRRARFAGEYRRDDIRDPLPCPTVTVWIGERHGPDSVLTSREDSPSLLEDLFGIGTHQDRNARLDTLGPFRDLPEDEDRCSKRRCLFLDPTGVRQDQMCAL